MQETLQVVTYETVRRRRRRHRHIHATPHWRFVLRPHGVGVHATARGSHARKKQH